MNHRLLLTIVAIASTSLAGSMSMAAPSKAVAYKASFDQYMNAGHSDFQRNNARAAISSYGEAVRLKPNDPYARKCLAYAYVAAGYATQGAQQMEAAGLLGVPTVADLCFAASAYVQAGDLARALNKYQLAVGAEGGNPLALVGLAEVEKKYGMKKEARTHAAKALSLATDDAVKQRAMNVLREEPVAPVGPPKNQPGDNSPGTPEAPLG